MVGENGEMVLHRVLPTSLSAYHEFIDEVLTALKAEQWGQRELFGVHMALEESISNAIRHGNKHDESKSVTVECRASARRFWARICDEGQGYCRDAIPDCRCDERLEVPGGRGLALIEAYMDLVELNDVGNCLTMEKRRNAETAGNGDGA
jgi:serine/threonine-protein kinase RsbW